MILRHEAQREGKLLSFLRRELGLSSTLVKRMKFRHAYTVNGQSVFTDFPVKIGDIIEVCMDEDTPIYPAEPGELSILYEDEALIALDKPAGILMHPSSARNSGTLANFLLHYYTQTGQKSAVHPVSRLDRDTFGVVLLAKNAHVHAKMHAMQLHGQIEKHYHAAVLGGPEHDEGLIDAPIARSDPAGMLRCVRADGKPARTRFRVLQRTEKATLLQLQPLTGRTHQLRVHCAHMGYPILGDPQYGTDDFGLPYQQLCAVSLRFLHPLTEKPIEIHSKQSVCLDF